MYMSSANLIGVATNIAEAILAGSMSPYEGGYRIWKECQLGLLPDDHSLDPFVYWSSEYEDTSDSERKAFCENAIKVAAEALVQHGSAL
jgi:hypothetical protein